MRPAPTASPKWRRNSESARIIVNLQGDEPEVSGEALDRVVALLARRPRGARWPRWRRRSATRRPIAIRRASRSSARRAAVRSTSRGARSPAIATASPIPRRRRGRSRISTSGLYAYRRDFLLSIAALPPSPLEAAEKLEQLRVLDAGYPIAVGIVEEASIGIDTPEDYRRFVERWRAGRSGRDAAAKELECPGAL